MTKTAGVGFSAREYSARALRSMTAPSTAPVWIAAIVLTSLASLFLAFGGFGPALITPTRAATGDEVRTSLYTVTVVRSELTDEIEERVLSAEPGEDLLLVTLVLENLTSTPAGVITSVDGVSSHLVDGKAPLLAIGGLDATDAILAWREERSSGPILQPHVPAEVRIVWRVPEGSFPEGTAFLDVYEAQVVRGQVIISSSAVTWRRTQQTAQISMRVAP